MSDGTAIQWTDATWNPVTGCTKVSPGCAHCYIDRTPAFRIAGRRFVRGATDLRLHHDRLEQPLRWRTPRRVFVNSLSDLFHPDVPFEFVDRVFAVMALARQHTFQILTKRPTRMREFFATGKPWQRIAAWAYEYNRYSDVAAHVFRHLSDAWPLPNVWIGVSVENQRFADERIQWLFDTPAAVRFVSLEPLLESVDLTSLNVLQQRPGTWPAVRLNALTGPVIGPDDVGGPRLDWVIVGGESGPASRGCRIAWVRDIVSQCRQAGVPVFVKQLGANIVGDPRPPIVIDPTTGARTLTVMQSITIRDRKGGDPLEWPDDLHVRQFPGGCHA